MNPIYIAIALLFVSLPVQAGEVWVVSPGHNPAMNRDMMTRKTSRFQWVVTESGHIRTKSCQCSSQCVCGCNQGKECTCNRAVNVPSVSAETCTTSR